MKFKITKRDFFEDNEDRGAELVFPGFSSDVCKFVTLVYDYFSPLHEMPLEIRKKHALRKVMPNVSEAKIGRWITIDFAIEIQKAVKIYKEIQYDDEYECYIGIKTQLELLSVKMKDTNKKLDTEESLKISNAIPKIVKEKRDMEKMLKYRIEMLDSEKTLGKDVSAIDRYHIMNQKRLMEEDN
jgi:hypothetical protein